jgi:hypothetical protein
LRGAKMGLEARPRRGAGHQGVPTRRSRRPPCVSGCSYPFRFSAPLSEVKFLIVISRNRRMLRRSGVPSCLGSFGSFTVARVRSGVRAAIGAEGETRAWGW